MLWLAGQVLFLAGCAAAPRADLIEIRRDQNRLTAQTRYLEGLKALEKEKPEQAAAAFQKALEADPRMAAAHNNLGALVLENGELYQAAWSFQRAIELDESLPDPHNNLGLTLSAAGRLEEAIGEFEAAAELDSQCGEYLANLLRAKFQRGDRDELFAAQLRDLLLLDQRPDWREWAEEQLMLMSRPTPREPDFDFQRSDGGGSRQYEPARPFSPYANPLAELQPARPNVDLRVRAQRAIPENVAPQTVSPPRIDSDEDESPPEYRETR